ncbi:MAG: nitroreductase family protein [Clostridia bacterium]|nr:nitroreductase family protein [Clostridia bacterium]
MLKNLIDARQSCRNFDPTRKVEKEKLQYALQCALTAPSARNRQPWQYTVVSNPQTADLVRTACQMGKFNAFLDDCPVFIVAQERPQDALQALSKAMKLQDFRPFDVGTSLAYFTLALEEQGVGSCYIGMFDEAKIKKAINSNKTVRMIVAVGYPKEGDVHREKSRRDFTDSVDFVE